LLQRQLLDTPIRRRRNRFSHLCPPLALDFYCWEKSPLNLTAVTATTQQTTGRTDTEVLLNGAIAVPIWLL
jgi:hypothetical protein